MDDFRGCLLYTRKPSDAYFYLFWAKNGDFFKNDPLLTLQMVPLWSKKSFVRVFLTPIGSFQVFNWKLEEFEQIIYSQVEVFSHFHKFFTKIAKNLHLTVEILLRLLWFSIKHFETDYGCQKDPNKTVFAS